MLLLALACATPEPYLAPDAAGDAIVGTVALGDGTQLWFPSTGAGDDLYRYGGMIQGDAREDGAPDCSVARPVLAFSHGNGGVPYQSLFLVEWLAARGWVVVAPWHTGNTAFDLDDAVRPQVAADRPRAVARAFDAAVAELPGCVDPDAGYAVAGHSFGGYTALATAGAHLDLPGLAATCAAAGDFLCGLEAVAPGSDLSDPRAWAAVALAPVGRVALGAGLAELAVPTLVLSGLDDTMTAWEHEAEPIFERMTASPSYLGGLVGAGHYAFSDVCFEDCDGLTEEHLLSRTVVTAFLDEARGRDEARAWLPPETDALTWQAR